MHKLILVVAPAEKTDSIISVVQGAEAHHVVTGTESDEHRRAVWVTVDPEQRQSLMDKMQAVLGVDNKEWQMFVLPIEAMVPAPEVGDATSEKKPTATTSREELYSAVEGGIRVDRNFIILVLLSTIVAAVGLLKDNVAAIIGAMVIAPLLGPNLALILGAALGDRDLIGRAIKANLSGLSIALMLCFILGIFITVDLNSHELISRTDIGIESVILALASGAAAALSLLSGLSATLVGVMVAVALLPPAATFGLLAGAGQWQLALGALTLLAVNVVCVNLSGQLVFWSRGVKPRSWRERKSAKRSIRTMLLVWIMSLALLAAIIYFYNPISVS